jgi:hypothetical protein
LRAADVAHLSCSGSQPALVSVPEWERELMCYFEDCQVLTHGTEPHVAREPVVLSWNYDRIVWHTSITLLGGGAGLQDSLATRS